MNRSDGYGGVQRVVQQLVQLRCTQQHGPGGDAGGGAQRVPMFTAHAMKVCAEVPRCDTATWGTHPDILQCVGAELWKA